MTRYAWPGNVRELRNAIEYAFVLCQSGGIDVQHLPPKIVSDADNACPPVPFDPAFDRRRDELIGALREAKGNRSRAAKALGRQPGYRSGSG